MKKKIERLEDINVMPGINFKLNQKLMRADDEARKIKIKIDRRQKQEKILLSIALAFTILATIIFAYNIFKDDDKNINDCISKGYSRQYCEKSIIGN